MSKSKLIMVIEKAARDFVDEQIASGEASYAADGGKSPWEISNNTRSITCS